MVNPTPTRNTEDPVETLVEARSQTGYALARDEGEAFWFFGMLQTVKIGKADTDGRHGILEILVPEGIGSPWHVHPEEDEWFYVLDGAITFWREFHNTEAATAAMT